MEVIINISEIFDKDLNNFSSEKQSLIKNKLNYLISLIKEDNSTQGYLCSLKEINLKEDLESSLYIFKVDKDTRIILTSENDTLFEEHILTLFRIVCKKDLDNSYKEVASSLYKSFMAQ
jgi:mRNA-degrading endonuclease YafQ of YafQ-DinJ toxin-antitoxin module